MMAENELWTQRAIEASDDQLYEDIARFGIGTELAEELSQSGKINADVPVGLQAMDDLRELGRRMFARMVSEMYDLFCGNGKDQNRKKLTDAVGISDTAAITIIAGFADQMFGLGAAACAALGALILKHVIKPSGSEMCKFWKERYL